MIAGGAVDDWRNAFCHNPAFVTYNGRVGMFVEYCRPFGLSGVDQLQLAVSGKQGRWAVAAYGSRTSLARYQEIATSVVVGYSPVDSLAVGTAGRFLTAETFGSTMDAVVSFDLGASWRRGVYAIAASALGVNEPRFANGDVVSLRPNLSFSFRPAIHLLLAFDVSKSNSDEQMAFGMELNIAPPLDLRVGIGYKPLFYGAGIGLRTGVISVDYSYRYHTRLQETHFLGLTAAWH